MREVLLERLGIELPVIQAPMAGLATPALVAAVSNAGALGSLGIAATDIASARAKITEVRAATDRPFNVNVFCHAPALPDPEREAAWMSRLRPVFASYGATPPESLSNNAGSFVDDDDLLALLLDTRPCVVSFHLGLPLAERIAALKQADIVLLASATSPEEGRAVQEAGIDAVVAQGWEAGGHRGVFDPDAPDARLGTFTLTRLLATSLSIPVIAAGGIMDGAGVSAALALGASAAQLGTAFLACPESAADAGYRAALAGEGATRTQVTRAISGRPARCLANRFTALAEDIPDEAVPAFPIAYDAGRALHAAARSKGEFVYAGHWAGQGAPLIRALPAAELIRQIAREAGLR